MKIDEWGAGIFAVTSDNRLVLITEDESNPKLRKLAGQISLPMGHLHSGEDALDCVLREFGEETEHSLELDMANVRHVGRIFLHKAGDCYAEVSMFAAPVLESTNGRQISPVTYATSIEIL